MVVHKQKYLLNYNHRFLVFAIFFKLLMIGHTRVS